MTNLVDGRQLRAGRIILGMSIREMADASGLHRNSVYRAEKLHSLKRTAYAADCISEALEAEGITFVTDGNFAGLHFQTLNLRVKPTNPTKR